MRRHDCHAEGNVRRLNEFWRGEELVTVWGCRRCPATWETVTSAARFEADHHARLAAQVAEAARRLRS